MREVALTIMRRTAVYAAALCVLAFDAGAAFSEPWWVFFRDEGGRQPGDPVSEVCLNAVTRAGFPIRTISRYFNAVSVETHEYPATLTTLACVSRIEPVRRFIRPEQREQPDPAIPSAGDMSAAHKTSVGDGHTLGYGVSYNQLNALNIPALHDMGLTGAGITIGVLDSGFPIEETGCFSGLDVAHVRNFVTGGEKIGGDSHGAYVLGCLAGALEKTYYGAAFGATYLLAVTDHVPTETRADEDRWVAAVEWCDSLGADIISSSLVYNEFDTVAESYTKEQMDGRTSLVAQAAEIAWSRGILVVNAAGNERGNSWGIITTPADAEHVLAVGALAFDGSSYSTYTQFSSHGPTADGRIKPDLAAPGERIYVPLPGSASSFYTISGTSYATPILAGLCALIMEARPSWSPADIVLALKDTADDLGPSGPDNDYGWGRPDGLRALDYTPVAVERRDCIEGPDGEARPEAMLLAPYPNPFNPTVTIPFSLDHACPVTITIHTAAGQTVARLVDSAMPAGAHAIRWEGSAAASGVYIVRLKTPFSLQTAKILLVR